MINSASLHWQVVFFFYLWATGEAPPSPNSKHQNAASCSEHQPNPCLAVREQYGHHSHSRLWTENGVGVSTMLTPFCGSVLHSDPNGIPGNLLEDACILLLTHIPGLSLWEFSGPQRSEFLSTKQVTVYQCERADDSGAGQTQALLVNTVLGSERWGQTTGHVSQLLPEMKLLGKKKSVKSESHHFPNSKTEWLFLFSIWKCSPLRNKVPGSNERNEF